MQSNPEKIGAIKNDKNFSKAFNVLLQERNATENAVRMPSSVAIDETKNVRSKQLRQYLQDLIEREKEATADRIEHYSKQQTALLKVFGDKVKQEFDDIRCAVNDVVPDVNRKHFDNGTNFDNGVIADNGSNNSKLLLAMSHLTPPVTPDSTPMSIGNSPNFRQQTSFLTAGGGRISALARQMASTVGSETTMAEKRLANPTRDGDVFFEIDGLDGPTDGYNDAQQDSDEDEENDDIDELGTYKL